MVQICSGANSKMYHNMLGYAAHLLNLSFLILNKEIA